MSCHAGYLTECEKLLIVEGYTGAVRIFFEGVLDVFSAFYVRGHPISHQYMHSYKDGKSYGPENNYWVDSINSEYIQNNKRCMPEFF